MNEVAVGEVATVRSGYAFKTNDWLDQGIPVLKITNVKDGRVVLDGCSFVNESVASRAADFEARKGDILISMTGYIGEMALIRDEGRMLVNQRVGKFFVKRADLIDPLFLFYALSSPKLKAAFVGHGYGSAQPNISPSLIERQLIPLPPITTQGGSNHPLSEVSAVRTNPRAGQRQAGGYIDASCLPPTTCPSSVFVRSMPASLHAGSG